jgi:hypothetical protein
MQRQLKALVDFYSDYFLNVRYTKAGTYTVQDETETFDRPFVNISRPGEDWCLFIEWVDGHYLVKLGECWAGSTLFEFCFQQPDGLLECIPRFQYLAGKVSHDLSREYMAAQPGFFEH